MRVRKAKHDMAVCINYIELKNIPKRDHSLKVVLFAAIIHNSTYYEYTASSAAALVRPVILVPGGNRQVPEFSAVGSTWSH